MTQKSFIKRSHKHEVYLPDLSTDQNKDHISVFGFTQRDMSRRVTKPTK